MALVRPFQAVRPTPERAKDVAALPYDVMNSAEAREMVKGNPYSFLHVDKAEIDLDPSVDLYDPQVYRKAAENLQAMVTQGILRQEKNPCFYIYRQTMDGRAQTGLVACTSIDEYLNNTIKKHELTREDKEQDRIRHVDICDANTGPIFLTYRAQAGIDEIISGWVKSHSPVYDFKSDDGIGHAVWVVDAAETIQALAEAFKQVPSLYIADGHHRNASAVKVGLMRREASGGAYNPEAEFNFYLSVIFPHDQLYIMDYNRVVKDLNGFSKDEFMQKVAEGFTVTPQHGPYRPEELHTFGMYLDGKWYKLAAKPENIPTDAVGALDVSILQNSLLAPVLNIQDPRTEKRIDFVGGMRGLAELERRVNSGEMTVAFSMFPTSLSELMGVADAGDIMPPKSTWFEPKLRSGLFIHQLS